MASLISMDQPKSGIAGSTASATAPASATRFSQAIPTLQATRTAGNGPASGVEQAAARPATSASDTGDVNRSRGSGRDSASNTSRRGGSRHSSTSSSAASSAGSPTVSQAVLPVSSNGACISAADCPNQQCIAGQCLPTSGFATLLAATASTLTTSTPAVQTSSTIARGHKGKHASTTACSDPRCSLPANISSLNGAADGEAEDASSGQRAVSSAATAGIVLALLFATLALLLIVPKVRSWTRRCFGCTKKDNGIILDEGSPDFGNSHASTFIVDKRQKIASSAPAQNGQRDWAAQALPGYEGGGHGDLADEKMHYGNEAAYPGYAIQDQQAALPAAPVLPNFYYENSRDLSAHIEHASAASLSHSNNVPLAPPTRPNQPRETVLPYTVDDDYATQLKNLVSPPANHGTNFDGPSNSYMTPVMQSSGFDSFNPSPGTPYTPGSAYSVRTTLLPASLRPAQGRAPILKRNPSGIRPNLKRISTALKFDGPTSSL